MTSADGQSLITLSEHGKAFKDRKFGSFHVLSCPSSDGEVELDGIYLKPARQGSSGMTPPIQMRFPRQS